MPIVHSPLRAGTPWPSTEHALTEMGKPLAPRREVAYICERGHGLKRTFAADVPPPVAVDCRCGGEARLPGVPSEVKPSYSGYSGNTKYEKHPAADVTPMGQLLKRRSREDLEALLAEKLREVRESGVAR